MSRWTTTGSFILRPMHLVAGEVEKFAKVKAEPALVLSIPEKPTRGRRRSVESERRCDAQNER